MNSRRLEVRGVVELNVKVTAQTECEIIADLPDETMQKQTKMVTVDGIRKCMHKRFTVREELVLGAGNPPIASVIYYRATAVTSDQKLLAGKVIAKGDIMLHFAYLPEGENPAPYVLEYAIPISQIAEIEGIDECCLCLTRFEVVSAEITCRTDAEQQNPILAVEFSVCMYCTCTTPVQQKLLCDAFSTACRCELKRDRVKLSRTTVLQPQPFMLETTVESPQNINEVYDVWVDVTHSSGCVEDGKLKLCGTVEVVALACDENHTPYCFERTFALEKILEQQNLIDGSCVDVHIEVVAVSYRISGENGLALQIEMIAGGIAVSQVECEALTDVQLTDELLPHVTAGMVLYFAKDGETVWSIAKRYHTSVTAIIQENDLEDEQLTAGTMLLIPYVAQ